MKAKELPKLRTEQELQEELDKIDSQFVSYDEYKHALDYIGELEKEIKYLREELEQRDFNDKYRW